jgi:superfamily II DNA or RNA helicase
MRPYQQQELDRLNTGESRGLFFEPGAGKTAVALHRVADSFARGEARRALVVSTPTIIASTWPGEIRDWAGTSHLKYVALTGSAAARERTLAQALADDDPSIVAIGFDAVHTLPADKLDAIDILVVDEASLARNPASRRFRALIQIAARAKQRIVMTGSPAPNSIMDIFGVVALIDLGEALGTSYRKFLDEASVQWGKKTWQRREKPGARAAVMQRIRHMCSSVATADVVDLPPLTRRVVEVQLPEAARAAYDTMETAAINTLTSKPVHRDACLIKCQQICNGFIYDEDGTARRVHQAKINAATDIVEEALAQGGSVMIVYHFAADLEAIRKAFKGVEVLGGPEATGSADSLVNRWNAGEIDVLAINPRAAGHGLNMQKNKRCRTQVWVSGTWSLELFEQAVARLWRPGQQNPLTVYVIVAAETVDEAVARVMERKQEGQAAVMAALKARAAERAAPDKGEAIRAARRAAARCHPDAGGSAEAFREAWAVYEALAASA